jgi:hypothetical protein
MELFYENKGGEKFRDTVPLNSVVRLKPLQLYVGVNLFNPCSNHSLKIPGRLPERLGNVPAMSKLHAQDSHVPISL